MKKIEMEPPGAVERIGAILSSPGFVQGARAGIAVGFVLGVLVASLVWYLLRHSA